MHGLIYRKILQDVGYIGLAQLLSTFSGLLSLSIITKLLGVEEYGIFVQYTVTIALAMTFANLGLPYTMVRFLAAEKDKKKISEGICTSLALVLVASSAIALIILIFAESIARQIFGGNTGVIKAIVFIIPVECLSWNLMNTYRVFQESNKYACITFSRTVLELLVTILVAMTGHGIFEIIVSIIAVKLVIFILLLIKIGLRIGLKVPKLVHVKEYLNFGLPTVPGSAATWITNSSDRYIISLFLGAIYVGYYSPGYALGGAINLIIFPINFVLVATLSKYYEENNMYVVRNIFNYALKYFLIIAIPAAFGISILSKPILSVISTPEIADEGYLITFFSAFGMLIYGTGIIVNYSLVLAKKTNVIMLNYITVAAINVVLNLVLIPYMGILGAGISTLFSYFVGFLLSVYFSRKYFDFEFDYTSIVKIIVSSIIMVLIILSTNSNTIFGIATTIITSVVVYTISIICLKTIGKSEKRFLLSYISSWLRI